MSLSTTVTYSWEDVRPKYSMETVAETVEYQNPAVTGFNPDPSVVHVEGIFYMATSTFHVFPGIPIYASTDLRQWKLIGHAINRPDQLSLFYSHSRLIQLENGNGMIATGGLQAPTIRHHNGTFYVVGSNMVRRDGVMSREQFIVTTTDIWNSDWSDPCSFDFHGFDTSIFVDDDERVYVQGAWATGQQRQPHTLIKQLELDLKTGKALTEPSFIWGGHSNYDTEGPHVYKKDGWYYLIVAEGGTFEHHMLTISRSRDIWGPYESYENNPILTADGKNTYIQGLGHGELFQDADGDWWVMALGFRSTDGVWPLGREPFLSRVEWPKNGWPSIEQPQMSFHAKKVPETATLPHIKPVSELVYLRGMESGNYQLSHVEGAGHIRMKPSIHNLDSLKGSPTFVGRRQKEHLAVAYATLDLQELSPPTAHVVAGLTVYLDPVRYTSLAFDFATSSVIFKKHLPASETSLEVSFAIDRSTTDSVEFKAEATASAYRFSFRQLNKTTEASVDWQSAGVVTTRELFVRFFTGPIFGLFVQTVGSVQDGDEPWVTFRSFHAASTESAAHPKALG